MALVVLVVLSNDCREVMAFRKPVGFSLKCVVVSYWIRFLSSVSIKAMVSMVSVCGILQCVGKNSIVLDTLVAPVDGM